MKRMAKSVMERLTKSAKIHFAAKSTANKVSGSRVNPAPKGKGEAAHLTRRPDDTSTPAHRAIIHTYPSQPKNARSCSLLRSLRTHSSFFYALKCCSKLLGTYVLHAWTPFHCSVKPLSDHSSLRILLSTRHTTYHCCTYHSACP